MSSGARLDSPRREARARVRVLDAWGWMLTGVVLLAAVVLSGLTEFVVVQAVLLGFGHLLIVLYAKASDTGGDRAEGRHALAAKVAASGNPQLICTLSLAEYLTSVVASIAWLSPWWFALAMLPVAVVRGIQYRAGFERRDLPHARRIGFAAHRVLAVLLLAANLVNAFAE